MPLFNYCMDKPLMNQRKLHCLVKWLLQRPLHSIRVGDSDASESRLKYICRPIVIKPSDDDEMQSDVPKCVMISAYITEVIAEPIELQSTSNYTY